MELGTIERELYVEATPEIVFEVVSDPAHVKQWWSDDARYETVVGSAGEILFADADGGKVEAFTVVDLQPPTRFSFRWTHPAGEEAVEGNSLLVTFELVPQGEGTLVRFRETGFRERGWEPPRSRRTTRTTSTGGTTSCHASSRTPRRWTPGHERTESTTSCGRRSATPPGARCSTCCLRLGRVRRPRSASGFR